MASGEVFSQGGRFFNGGLANIEGNLSVAASGVTAPNTAPASIGIIATNAATPQMNLTLAQTAPLLNTGGTILQAYATATGAPARATSLMVCRPSVSSASLSYPPGSIGGPGTGVGAATIGVGGNVRVDCAPITATSIVKIWLVGLPALAVAAGLTAAVPAPAVAIDAVAGNFTITGLAGTVWGYEVMFA